MPVPAQQDVPPQKRRSITTGGGGTATLRCLYGEATGVVGHVWVFDETGHTVVHEQDVTVAGLQPVTVDVPDAGFVNFQNSSQWVVNLSFVPTAT